MGSLRSNFEDRLASLHHDFQKLIRFKRLSKTVQTPLEKEFSAVLLLMEKRSIALSRLGLSKGELSQE